MKKTPYIILFIGILAVSTASVIIRIIAAPPLVTAFYRLFWASIIFMFPVAVSFRRELIALTRRQLLLSILSGFFLALHFALWITSLEYTAVASSVALVTTHPLLVVIFTSIFWKQRPGKKIIIGILTALVGVFFIGGGSLTVQEQSFTGDLLALGGAVMMAGYLLVGSYLRRKLTLIIYIFITYLSGAVFLFIYMLGSSVELISYSGLDHLLFFMLALVPTGVGHSSFNWALKYVPTYHVSISILGEPVGATFLAYIILKEAPVPATVLGGLLVITGIYWSLRADKRREAI